jgi:hypothetical protein
MVNVRIVYEGTYNIQQQLFNSFEEIRHTEVKIYHTFLCSFIA